MTPAPIPSNERERLAALRALRIVDTPPEREFDRITDLLRRMFAVPIAAISLVDEQREWLKAACGVTAREGDRSVAFCAHTILRDGVFVVEDALVDERFSGIPQVRDQGVRFYAGAPLRGVDGLGVGTLCIKDHRPRVFGEHERSLLAQLAATVVDLMSHRLSSVALRDKIVETEQTNQSLRQEIERRVRVSRALERTWADLERAHRAAEAANRAKSEFLANMSHEIRTPMTAILGFVDLLCEEEGLGVGRRREYLDTIRRNGEHLLSIINDILDLSKIEAGKLRVEHAACSPVRLAQEVVELMGDRAARKGLEFRVEFDPNLPRAVRTDPTRVRQVLINLVGNAIKFTDQGYVRLAARLEAGGEPRLVFDVVDTGVGICPEDTEKLFRPFSQADSSLVRRFGGTGLGLTISKRLAAALGGDIELVDARLGGGAHFRFRITAEVLEGAGATSTTEERAAPRPSQGAVVENGLRGRRILLAEDGPDNQRLISHVLRKAGAEVTVAENGRVAVECALTAPPDAGFDLVLMDIQMPVMNGHEAIHELRDRGFRRPIVALTAHAMDDDRRRCMQAGCDEFLTKPISRDLLIGTVRRLTDRGPADGSCVSRAAEQQPAANRV